MVYDIHHHYPRAYIHQHKLHKCLEGFNAQGPSEVYDLLRSIDALVMNGDPSDRGEVLIPKPTGIGIMQYQLKKIYPKSAHIVANNHFSGDEVMKLFGKKGYGCTMTNHRDCFPQGMKEYLHHEKVSNGCGKAKAIQSLQSNSVLLSMNQRVSLRLWYPFSQQVQRIFVVWTIFRQLRIMFQKK